MKIIKDSKINSIKPDGEIFKTTLSLASEEEVAGVAKEAEVVEEEVLERSETGIKIMEDK